jgi:hypothetical protein
MSPCRDRPCTAAAHDTARQARDASKFFSVAPDHVVSCIESVGTLYYLSRLVCGLPTFYSGDFPKSPEFPKKVGITQTPTSKWCGLVAEAASCSHWEREDTCHFNFTC